MRITSRLAGALLGLFACIPGAACTSGHHAGQHAQAPAADQSQPVFPTPTVGQNNDQPGAPGAPGAPGGKNGGNGPAPGAPIKVPAIIQDSGHKMYGPEGVYTVFMNGGTDPGTEWQVEGILSQCGGTKCVTVEIRHRSNPPRTLCDFDDMVPEAGSVVPRSLKTVIVLYTGDLPCKSPTPGDNGGQSPNPGNNGGPSPSSGDGGGQSPDVIPSAQ